MTNYREILRLSSLGINHRQITEGMGILDEWLLYQLKEPEARDLLEIAESRYKRASTIFCSQHDVGDWHQKIGESTIADAILDRIVHDSYRIVIASNHDDSVSMRQRKGLTAH